MRGGGGCWKFSTGFSRRPCTWRSRRKKSYGSSRADRASFSGPRRKQARNKEKGASMTHAIFTERLTKYYGARCVVNCLDLHVPIGTVYGFLGRNGAGK